MAPSHNEGVQVSINSAPLVPDHLGCEVELAYATVRELTALLHPIARRPSQEVHGGPWDQGSGNIHKTPVNKVKCEGSTLSDVDLL